MAITEEMKAAWKICNFCSKSTNEIAEIIKTPSRWQELPLGYKCAWARISQVGFPRFGRKQVWKDLCNERAYFNNAPQGYGFSSKWEESYCANYQAVVDQPSKK